MKDKQKKIEEYLENKLRNTALKQPSKDFNKYVMDKVRAGYKVYVSEAKTDRIIKYAIGSFATLVIGIIILFGVAAKTSQHTDTVSMGINVSPAVHISANLLEKFIAFIQNIFVDVLESLGVTISPATITVFVVGLLVTALFIMGEKFLLKDKLKSARAR